MVKPIKHHTSTYHPTALIGATPSDVMKELRRRSLAGEVHSAGPEILPITTGPHAGRYGVPVMLRVVERPARAARRANWVLPAACLASAGAILGAVWWLLSSLSGTALAVLCGTVLVVFLAGVRRATRVVLADVRRATRVTVTTTTKVTIR